MLKISVKILSLVAVVAVLLSACKKQEKNWLLGKWDLIYWDNQMQEGVLVFKDSAAFFSMDGNMEMTKYKINKDTIRFYKTGGTFPFLAGPEYWIINHADSIFLKLVSATGNITTAHKMTAEERAKAAKDSVYIKL